MLSPPLSECTPCACRSRSTFWGDSACRSDGSTNPSCISHRTGTWNIPDIHTHTRIILCRLAVDNTDQYNESIRQTATTDVLGRGMHCRSASSFSMFLAVNIKLLNSENVLKQRCYLSQVSNTHMKISILEIYLLHELCFKSLVQAGAHNNQQLIISPFFFFSVLNTCTVRFNVHIVRCF